MRDKIVRAARFIEEAAELVQAVGLPKDHVLRALDYVYSRPAGEPAQEMGGVSNTQYALAGALGLSVAVCEDKEIARCLAKDPAHFAQRNKNKVEVIDRAALTEPAQEPKPCNGGYVRHAGVPCSLCQAMPDQDCRAKFTDNANGRLTGPSKEN